MLPQRKTQNPRKPRAKRKLHSVHGLLRRHSFVGRIEWQGTFSDFEFAPDEALLVNAKLVLNGGMSLGRSGSFERSVGSVRATLLGTQGAVGASPVRRQLLTGTAQTAQTATSEQNLEQEKGPETELQPGLHAFEKPGTDQFGRPEIESTGTLGFVGVLYFQLSPLDGIGLPFDVSDVQLNARLAPADDTARDLVWLYSDLIGAIDGKQRDAELANSALESINRIFKESNRL
jgi:hypothetical protein